MREIYTDLYIAYVQIYILLKTTGMLVLTWMKPGLGGVV